jgi:hypothetical protein
VIELLTSKDNLPSETDVPVPKDPFRLLTPEQAARQLRRSVRTVHALVREKKLECVQQSPRIRFFLQEHIDQFIQRHTVTLPNPVDKSTSNGLPFPRKGGEKKKSTGDSLSERKRMKEELRSCR